MDTIDWSEWNSRFMSIAGKRIEVLSRGLEFPPMIESDDYEERTKAVDDYLRGILLPMYDSLDPADYPWLVFYRNELAPRMVSLSVALCPDRETAERIYHSPYNWGNRYMAQTATLQSGYKQGENSESNV